MSFRLSPPVYEELKMTVLDLSLYNNRNAVLKAIQGPPILLTNLQTSPSHEVAQSQKACRDCKRSGLRKQNFCLVELIFFLCTFRELHLQEPRSFLSEFNGKRVVFSTNGYEQLEIHIQKKKNRHRPTCLIKINEQSINWLYSISKY